MILKPRRHADIEDWLTPPQVEIRKVTPPAERLEWLAKRAEELKETMGTRYLCHETNRVRRLDGRSYRSHDMTRSNVTSITKQRDPELIFFYESAASSKSGASRLAGTTVVCETVSK